MFPRDKQYFKFCAYGFIKNLKFFDPYILLFLRSSGLTFLEIGTLYSIRELSTYILELPTGFTADTVGRRGSLSFAFLSYMISFILFSLFRGFWPYAGAMILFGLGEALRSGTHKAMILEYLELNNLKKYKTDYYGHTRSWSQTGSALSALIAGILLFITADFRVVFYASCIPYAAGLFLVLSYPRALDRIKKSPSDTVKNSWYTTFNTFSFLFKNKKLWKGYLNSSIHDSLFKTSKDYIQPVLRAMAVALPAAFLPAEHRSIILISLVYTVLFLLNSFASSLSGQAEKLFSSLPRAMNLSFPFSPLLILTAGFFLLVKLPSFALIPFLLLFMVMNIRRPLCLSYLSENIPSAIMVSGLSLESLLKTIITSLLAPLAGWIIDRFAVQGTSGSGIGFGLIALALIGLMMYPLVIIRKDKKSSA